MLPRKWAWTISSYKNWPNKVHSLFFLFFSFSVLGHAALQRCFRAAIGRAHSANPLSTGAERKSHFNGSFGSFRFVRFLFFSLLSLLNYSPLHARKTNSGTMFVEPFKYRARTEQRTTCSTLTPSAACMRVTWPPFHGTWLFQREQRVKLTSSTPISRHSHGTLLQVSLSLWRFKCWFKVLLWSDLLLASKSYWLWFSYPSSLCDLILFSLSLSLSLFYLDSLCIV